MRGLVSSKEKYRDSFIVDDRESTEVLDGLDADAVLMAVGRDRTRKDLPILRNKYREARFVILNYKKVRKLRVDLWYSTNNTN